MHGFDGPFIFILGVFDLFVDDLRGAARSPPVIEEKGAFQLVHQLFFQAERVDDRGAVLLEFDEVKSPENGCVLILLPARKVQVFPLDLVGELRLFVFGKPEVQPAVKCFQNRHHHGGGSAQAAADGRVVGGGHDEGKRLSAVEFFHDAIIHALM